MNRPAADENGRNFFHAIAAAGHPKLATRTLGTTPRKVVVGGLTAKDGRGRTPLHVAAYAGHLRVLRAFADAVPEALAIRDQDGNSVREALRRRDADVGDNPATRFFNRMLTIEKLGYTLNELPFGPADVWDVAVSSTATAVVVQPTWGTGTRELYQCAKGAMTRIDLGAGNVPRFVANSNLHTLVLTEDKCFAWGKNVNGILGLETDDKTVHTPQYISERFITESFWFERNAFSALGGTVKAKIKDPLVGVACCDFYSACCTKAKVWAWGANRGQMMGRVLKNTIVEMPDIVFESGVGIRGIACADNALVVLLSNGIVMVLHSDKITRLVLGKGQTNGEAVAAKGRYIAVQTNKGKLLRFAQKALDEHSTVWTPRKPKDAIMSFDIAETGAAIVATKAGVYKIEDGRELTELNDIKGLQFTLIKTDSHFRSFVGIQRLVAGLGHDSTAAPIRPRYSEVRSEVLWESTAPPPASGLGISLRVGESAVAVHKALLYARCPTLRPLLQKSSEMVAAPGGSAILRLDGADIAVSHVPLKAVIAFVASLRFASCTSEDIWLEASLEQGPELHEYLALRRLVTRDLGDGLWDARLAAVGCDVEVHGTLAHSQVLASASPVWKSQLDRWGGSSLFTGIPDDILEQLLRYAYTTDLTTVLTKEKEGRLVSKADQVQQLYDLWNAADELLMACLSTSCEQKLFEMLDSDLVVPLLLATSGPATAPSSELRSSLLDIFVRYMDFFWQGFTEFDNDTAQSLEVSFKALQGTEEIDQELAESFESLRQLALSTMPQSSKKKKASSATPSSSHGASPVPTASASVQQPAAQGTANKPALTSPIRASVATPVPASVPPSVSLSVSGAAAPAQGDNGGAWIQARRKSRTSSHNTQEKSGFMGRALASPPGSSSLASSPSPSSSLAASPVPSASSSNWASSISASPGAVSPASASSTLNTRGTASSNVGNRPAPSTAPRPSPSRTSGLPQLGRPVAKQDTASKLVALPSLPTLGSQPAQRATAPTRGTRSKFNPKDRKRLQQFEDPSELVQQLEKNTSKASPWKQVTATSSQPLLERLERAHQINSKRASGSVWGS